MPDAADRIDDRQRQLIHLRRRPGTRELAANLGDQLGTENLVRVQIEQPVVPGMIFADPFLMPVAQPTLMHDLGTSGDCDLHRAVGRAGIDDDYLVAEFVRARDDLPDPSLLVERTQVAGDRQAKRVSHHDVWKVP